MKKYLIILLGTIGFGSMWAFSKTEERYYCFNLRDTIINVDDNITSKATNRPDFKNTVSITLSGKGGDFGGNNGRNQLIKIAENTWLEAAGSEFHMLKKFQNGEGIFFAYLKAYEFLGISGVSVVYKCNRPIK